MADGKGNVIAPPTAPTKAHEPKRPDSGEGRCEGCGEERHGSVGREIACVTSALRRERAQTMRQAGELSLLRKVLDGVREALRGT